jgi:hypothetical protein
LVRRVSLRRFCYKLSSVLLTGFCNSADGSQSPTRQQAAVVGGNKIAKISYYHLLLKFLSTLS